jgi:hypothetical protein
MNPHYLWLAETLELIFFFSGPAIAIVIAYRALRERRGKSKPKPYGMRCIAAATTAVVLFGLARWMNAEVSSPLYFVQLACALLSLLAFGAAMGYFVPVLVNWWRWHSTTRAK